MAPRGVLVLVGAAALLCGAHAYDTEESVVVGTDDNFAEIIEENAFVLAEFYAPWCGHCKSLAPEYAAAAKKLVVGNSLPPVIEFTDESAPKIFGGEIKTHLLLFVKKSSDAFDALLEGMTAVAGEYKGDILFIWVNCDNTENDRILEFFGISSDQLPNMLIIKMGDDEMKKYAPASTEINTAAIKEFAQSFKDGKLKPHLKTQDVPEDWNSKPVKVLVGKNFVDVALDATKDVLVEFYAPWCGHCKQLAPIYDKLGEAYEDVADVVIAKMDSTENEVEQVSISGFPTIKFFPKGETGEVVDYDGGRTLKDFVEFLKDKTGHAGASDDGNESKESGGDAHEEL